MNQYKVILRVPSGGHTSLSSDGNFLVYNTSLYRANGGTYSLDGTLPYSTINYVQFFDDEPSVLLVVTDSKIIKYDCVSRTELISWDVALGNYPYPQLDQSSKKLSYYVNNPTSHYKKVTLFDLEAGVVQKEILVSGNWFGLVKDILLDQRGFALRDY